MPSVSVHLEQAQLNEQAANDVRSSYPDWAVTMCFYSGLHYIEAFAALHGDNLFDLYPEGISQHERRLNYVVDLAIRLGTDDLLIAYRRLYDTSLKARYLKGLTTNANRYFKIGFSYYFSQLETVKRVLSFS